MNFGERMKRHHGAEEPRLSARQQRPEAILERQTLGVLGADPNLAIFRNEVGQGYYGALGPALAEALKPFGPEVLAAAKAVLNRHRVTYGLHVGSADLIGVATMRIEPQHVGRRIGRFVSLELKSADGRLRPEQVTWMARMRELGATAEEARTPGDAVLAVEKARRGE